MEVSMPTLSDTLLFVLAFVLLFVLLTIGVWTRRIIKLGPHRAFERVYFAPELRSGYDPKIGTYAEEYRPWRYRFMLEREVPE
jgi:hypothetical protein